MRDYEKMYYTLFNKITDTIEELKAVQQSAENIYIENDENSDRLYKNIEEIETID